MDIIIGNQTLQIVEKYNDNQNIFRIHYFLIRYPESDYNIRKVRLMFIFGRQ